MTGRSNQAQTYIKEARAIEEKLGAPNQSVASNTSPKTDSQPNPILTLMQAPVKLPPRNHQLPPVLPHRRQPPKLLLCAPMKQSDIKDKGIAQGRTYIL